MAYAAVLMPFDDERSNIIYVLEEFGTFLVTILLVALHGGFDKEFIGFAVITVVSGVVFLSMIIQLKFLLAHCKKKKRGKSIRVIDETQ